MLTGVRVLVVEDEPLVALDLEASFRGAGATVTCAVSIVEALELVERDQLDFAVLDTQLWRNERSFSISDKLLSKGIPFAIFSGFQTAHAGAIAHIMKPVTPDQVIAVAEEYLRLRRL